MQSKCKQLLLFIFALWSLCQYSMAEENPAAQKQTAVTAHFSSQQLLLFAFAERATLQRQTAVTVYFSSKQLLLFAIAVTAVVSPHEAARSQ